MDFDSHDGSRLYAAPGGTVNVNEAAGPPRVGLFTVHAPPEMVGRDREVTELVEQISSARRSGRPVVVSAVSGMAGVGKTALARAAVARLEEAFPVARLEVDLLGFTPGEEPRTADDVLTELLSIVAPGMAPPGVDAKSQWWRGWLAARSVLLLLDNVRTIDQITPLLPGANSHSTVVLITSRLGLDDDLPTAVHTRLDLLPQAEAIALLQRHAPDPARTSQATWAELAEACGRLPLLLTPVAALLRRRTPHMVLVELHTNRSAEPALPKIEKLARSAFEVSFSALPEHLPDVLLACGRHPGPDFDARSLAALLDTTTIFTAPRLDDLYQHGMIISLGGGRYTLHDLFLTYTRDRLTDPTTDQAARERLYQTMSTAADTATDAVTGPLPDRSPFTSSDDVRSWLISATNELRTITHTAISDRSPHTRRLVRSVGWWLTFLDRHDHAEDLYAQATDLYQQIGDRLGQANTLDGRGDIALMRNDYDRAEDLYAQATHLYQQIGNRLGQANTL
ncbi:tetratricopeptide repeat protein, partial [Actinomadura parmotrematis]